jgi:hypothetical protein
MNEVIGPYIPPKRQVEILPVSSQMVDDYWNWFVVNSHTFLKQRHTPTDNGKFSYYAASKKIGVDPVTGGDIREKLPLTKKDIEMHLAGLQTISLYAIEPEHSTCKWIAIDADHNTAFTDLAVLQQELKQEGIEALLEKSRRGGHLWVFAAEPLPADLCRILVYTLALGSGLAIKGFNHEVEGLEIFPKQDRLEEGFIGNGLRGPLGVHRATSTRYWFDSASSKMPAQFDLVRNARRLTLAELISRTEGLTIPNVDEPPPIVPIYTPTFGYRPNAFDITQHVTFRRKDSRNMWSQCPSCEKAGKDRGRDNLAVKRSDTKFYKCWAGCTADDIRAACGAPPSSKRF